MKISCGTTKHHVVRPLHKSFHVLNSPFLCFHIQLMISINHMFHFGAICYIFCPPERVFTNVSIFSNWKYQTFPLAIYIKKITLWWKKNMIIIINLKPEESENKFFLSIIISLCQVFGATTHHVVLPILAISVINSK